MTTALSIEHLRFRYPGSNNGAAIRWHVEVPSLTLQSGEQLLVTGGSGCGKSTLLHLIAGLLDPNEGTMRVGDCDLHAFHGAQRDIHRGRMIGMIFQTFNLLHGFSAAENVMAALMFADPRKFPPREHRSRAMSLLKSLGISDGDANPDQMSVGQQQRVAVARAIVCQPVLVLADEPTASLDPENAAAAMDLIQHTCGQHNAALLCVSHDPAMAERFENRKAMTESARWPASV